MLADQPGLLTLRHKLISTDPALAAWLVRQVESVQGVRRGAVRPLSGTLKIHFDPAQTRTERLLRVLEGAPDLFRREIVQPSEPAPVRFGLVNTAMALSVVSDFLVPSVWPATAAFLVGSNLGMFRAAAAQLGRKQFGLPVLYTTIAAGTLATRQFLPWAAMNWMLRFWKYRYQQDLQRTRRRLLGEVIQQERFARIEAPGGIEIEVPVDRLAPGDLILVSPGEKLPVDGRIVRGHGLIDERMVRGTSGMTRKSPEEAIDAGSIVLFGDFQVETRRHGPRTRAASLGRIALAAANHPLGTKTPTLKGENFADRVVAPSLAAAGLGFALGGVPTALAILDTDYASGPGLAYPLESLQALSLCYQHGIVVRDAEALDRLAKVDVLLLDHHPALEMTDPEVASVRVFPGHTEFQVLQYAATAFRDLDDERTTALRAECRSRRIALLDRIPTDYGTDVMLIHRGQVIKVGNLGGQGPVAEQAAGAPRSSRAAVHRFPDGRHQRADCRPDRFSTLGPSAGRGGDPGAANPGPPSPGDRPGRRNAAIPGSASAPRGSASTFTRAAWRQATSSSSSGAARGAGSRSLTPAFACRRPGPPVKPTWPSRSTPTAWKTWTITPPRFSCSSPT